MRRRFATLAVALVAATQICVPAVRADEPPVTPLNLTKPDIWAVEGNGENVLSLAEKEGRLQLRFKAKPGNEAKLLLQQPIPIPEGTTGLTFLGMSDPASSGMYLHVMLRDAAGKNFLAYTQSPPSYQKGLFYPEHPARRCREVRFSVPALARPVIEGLAGANIIPPAPNVNPKLPFTLVGLDLIGEHQSAPSEFTDLYLSGFALTALSPANSDFYYQFEDSSRFGELDALPTITPGHFNYWGKRISINWTARKAYDGVPFREGGQDFTLDDPESERLRSLKFARRVEIPITAPGTYWIKVKVRWYERKSVVPTTVREFDYRLYVIKNKRPGSPVEAGAAPASLVSLGDGQNAFSYAPGTKALVPVTFQKSSIEFPDPTYVAYVRVPSSKEVLKTANFQPVWGAGGKFTSAISLEELPPGPYEVEAQVLSGKAIMDRETRLVGKRMAVAAKPEPIPAGVPTWREITASAKPMFHLSPMLSGNSTEDRWPQLKAFIDEMPPVSKELELSVWWRDVEPLPGVYDWSEIDRALEYAKSKGVSLLLWPQLVGHEPEWLPSFYTQNKEGSITGHTSYLFHGGRINYWQAPVIKEAAMNLMRAMTNRYRSHPALQGYFVLTEQPGDASWAGWYEGFDPETKAAFRAFAKTKYLTLAALNKVWGTNWTVWEQVEPPAKGSGRFYGRDWQIFRRDGYHRFLLDSVKAIRAIDDQRLLMVYNDGIDLNRLGDFRDLGCVLANGGSQDPERGSPKYLATALQGVQERTEDITPGRWGAGPFQLDASVFSMTMGGGGNTHCKAYEYSGKTFASLRQPPYSLDKFEKFMPIWTELRGTIPMPVDTFVLNSSIGVGGDDPWTNMMCAHSHLIAAAGGLALGEKGKLLLSTGQNEAIMEQSAIDGVVRYVQNGGTFVMRADSGRYCPQIPEADWVLLSKFGVKPPARYQVEVKKEAVPVVGEVLKDKTPQFILRDLFWGGAQDGLQPLATFKGQPNEVAMSWKPVGKGKLVVIWAQTLVPEFEEENPDGVRSFLRDIANWAGVRSYTDATRPEIWTNLLQAKDGKAFYGLAYRMVWQDPNPKDSSGSVRYRLPAGKYEITEVISGINIGRMDAAQLADQGLKLTLKPRAVALYRFRPVTQ